MSRNSNSRASRRKQAKKRARSKEIKKKLLAKRKKSREEAKIKKEIWKIKRAGEKETNRLINATIRKQSNQQPEE
jgi:CRISPR/Cas system-associated protein Cas5 (RAMP superfamily)